METSSSPRMCFLYIVCLVHAIETGREALNVRGKGRWQEGRKGWGGDGKCRRGRESKREGKHDQPPLPLPLPLPLTIVHVQAGGRNEANGKEGRHEGSTITDNHRHGMGTTGRVGGDAMHGYMINQRYQVDEGRIAVNNPPRNGQNGVCFLLHSGVSVVRRRRP
ncbi:hypothetical protein LX36DRAFT_303828 [Colletotrichum falcatum]|nr:hypothetical protein LX36DRAFT_303828 [Colletotrichum falcatum]